MKTTYKIFNAAYETFTIGYIKDDVYQEEDEWATIAEARWALEQLQRNVVASRELTQADLVGLHIRMETPDGWIIPAPSSAPTA